MKYLCRYNSIYNFEITYCLNSFWLFHGTHTRIVANQSQLKKYHQFLSQIYIV